MNVIDALRTRRAVKFFSPDTPITDEEVKELIEYSMLSPTAFNLQHWRFLHIRDAEVRTRIREFSFNQPQVTDASALILVCMDLKAWNKNPERYWSHAPENLKRKIVQSIGDIYRDDDLAERDEAFRSCGLASMSLMLASQAKGYDSCPMVGFDFESVGKLVEMPEDHIIGMMVAIGHKLEDPWPRGGRLSLRDVFFIDKFN